MHLGCRRERGFGSHRPRSQISCVASLSTSVLCYASLAGRGSRVQQGRTADVWFDRWWLAKDATRMGTAATASANTAYGSPPHRPGRPLLAASRYLCALYRGLPVLHHSPCTTTQPTTSSSGGLTRSAPSSLLIAARPRLLLVAQSLFDLLHGLAITCVLPDIITNLHSVPSRDRC